MKLQVAIDVLGHAQALSIAASVAPYADVIEIGTPLIKSQGMNVVSAIREAHPDTEILADTKTADTGGLEADLVFDAGADWVAVLGTSDDSTIRAAVTAARARGKRVIVDLIHVPDKITRARQALDLGADMVEFHSAADERNNPGFSFTTLLAEARESGVPFAFASGITIDTIADVRDAGAAVAVIGQAICAAPDPAASAHRFRQAINR